MSLRANLVVEKVQGPLVQSAHRLARQAGVVWVGFGHPERRFALELRDRVRKERDLRMNYMDVHQLAMAAKRTEKLGGDIAEVGAFEGASAKIIAEVKGQRPLHLFDTFEGLPEPLPGVDTKFHAGQFRANEDEVRRYLAEFDDVHVHKACSRKRPVTSSMTAASLWCTSTSTCTRQLWPASSSSGPEC